MRPAPLPLTHAHASTDVQFLWEVACTAASTAPSNPLHPSASLPAAGRKTLTGEQQGEDVETVNCVDTGRQQQGWLLDAGIGSSKEFGGQPVSLASLFHLLY